MCAGLDQQTQCQCLHQPRGLAVDNLGKHASSNSNLANIISKKIEKIILASFDLQKQERGYFCRAI